jgi:hypothetical protein
MAIPDLIKKILFPVLSDVGTTAGVAGEGSGVGISNRLAVFFVTYVSCSVENSSLHSHLLNLSWFRCDEVESSS